MRFSKFKIFFILFLCLTLFLFNCKSKKNKNKAIPTDEIGKLSLKIEEDPKNAVLYAQRAKLYIDGQKIDSALKDISKAIAIDSNKSMFYVTLSDVYFAMGRISLCSKTLEQALMKDKKNIDAILKIAEINLYLKEYKISLENIEKALAIENLNPKAYFMKGMALKEYGDTFKAVEAFKKTIEQDANYYHSFIQLGILYAKKHDKLAIAYYNNAININPKSTEAFYGLAMYYQESGDLKNAIRNYEKIIEVDPNYKNAYYNLGYINLVFLKDYQKAVKCFTEAIANDSKYVEAYYNRGYSYELLKDFKNARIDYQNALKLKPDYTKPLEGLRRVK